MGEGEKSYVFDTTDGRKSLADLFGDNSQLIVHHFMWRHDLDSGCPSCSFEADHAEGALVHLINHDVSYVHVARAPIGKLIAYGNRLGWKAPWASSLNNDFNFDYHVSFTKDELASGSIYYNFEEARTPRVTRATSCRASACSTRTRPARCITPTRPTRAATRR